MSTQTQSRQVKRAAAAAEDKAAKVTAKAAKRYDAALGFAKAGTLKAKAGERLEALTIRLNAEAVALSTLSVEAANVLAEAHHLTKATAKRMHKGGSVVNVSTSVTTGGTSAIKLGDLSSGLAWEWVALGMVKANGKPWDALTFYANVAAMAVGYYLQQVDSLKIWKSGAANFHYRVKDTALVMAAMGVKAAPSGGRTRSDGRKVTTDNANVFTPLTGKALAEAKRTHGAGFFDLVEYAKANADAFDKVYKAIQAAIKPQRDANAADATRKAKATATREAKAAEALAKAGESTPEAKPNVDPISGETFGWYSVQCLDEMFTKAIWTTPSMADYLRGFSRSDAGYSQPVGLSIHAE